MKKSRVLFVCLLLIVGFTVVISQVPQKKGTPIGSNLKITNFIKFIQTAISMEEVAKAYAQAGFTKSEADELTDKIKASSALQEKLRSLGQKTEAAAQEETPEIKKKMQERLTVLTARKEEVNKQSMQTALASLTRMKAGPKMMALETDECIADYPSVSSVATPVCPGMDLLIVGKGFGKKKDRSGVTIDMQGKTFQAPVAKWGGCVITAMLPLDIAGVKRDKKAIVTVTTGDGKTALGSVEFIAYEDIKMRRQYRFLVGPPVTVITFFNFVLFDDNLKNDWQLIDHNLIPSDLNGHSEIKETSPLRVPNGRARLVVHSDVGFFGMTVFNVYQFAMGPRGLSPW